MARCYRMEKRDGRPVAECAAVALVARRATSVTAAEPHPCRRFYLNAGVRAVRRTETD
ncbi:MAG: hypothetical protein ACYSWQ_12265 [Planctomycetota bacterium]